MNYIIYFDWETWIKNWYVPSKCGHFVDFCWVFLWLSHQIKQTKYCMPHNTEQCDKRQSQQPQACHDTSEVWPIINKPRCCCVFVYPICTLFSKISSLDESHEVPLRIDPVIVDRFPKWIIAVVRACKVAIVCTLLIVGSFPQQRYTGRKDPYGMHCSHETHTQTSVFPCNPGSFKVAPGTSWSCNKLATSTITIPNS